MVGEAETRRVIFFGVQQQKIINLDIFILLIWRNCYKEKHLKKEHWN